MIASGRDWVPYHISTEASVNILVLSLPTDSISELDTVVYGVLHSYLPSYPICCCSDSYQRLDSLGRECPTQDGHFLDSQAP